MNNWKEYKLGEMIDCNPTVKLKKGELYPVIDIDKIEIGNRYVTNKDYIVYDGQSSSKFQNGDTLLARITPCLENGKVATCKIDKEFGFGSTEFFVFRGLKNKTDNDFVFYFMSSSFIRRLAANSMTGASGRQRADLTFIKNRKFYFPDFIVQQKIANILSRYDEAIENNNKRIKLLEQMAQNLYKEWFVRFRFPGWQNAEFENGIPKGWKVEKLGNLYDTTSGGTPSREHEEYYQNGIYPWIKTGELKDYPILETEERITEEALKHSSAKLFEKDSLIIAMYGATIGQLGINKMDSTCNQACCVLRPKIDKAFGIYYLYNYFKVNRDFIIGLGNGAAQRNLSQDLIKKLKLLNPSKEILKKFEQNEKLFFEQIYTLQKKNQNLAKQRDLLLPRLMSGKLEVE